MRSPALGLLLLTACTGRPLADPTESPPLPTPAPAPVSAQGEPWFVPGGAAPASRPARPGELQAWIATDALPPTDSLPGLVFAFHGASMPTSTRPAIVSFAAAHDLAPHVIDFAGLEGFEQARWVAVEVSHDRRRIWLIADSAVEAPGWQLAIVTSDDGGRQWHVRGRVRKPYYLATLDSLHMDAGGRGALVLRWDDDPAAPIGGAAPGRYTYRTGDFGATWSDPEFTPDDLVARAAFGGDDVAPGTTVEAWLARRRARGE